jgi:hypothetical protein
VERITDPEPCNYGPEPLIDPFMHALMLFEVGAALHITSMLDALVVQNPEQFNSTQFLAQCIATNQNRQVYTINTYSLRS